MFSLQKKNHYKSNWDCYSLIWKTQSYWNKKMTMNLDFIFKGLSKKLGKVF